MLSLEEGLVTVVLSDTDSVFVSRATLLLARPLPRSCGPAASAMTGILFARTVDSCQPFGNYDASLRTESRTCVTPVDRMPIVLHFPTRLSHSNNAGDQLPAVEHFCPSRTCVSPVDRMPDVLHFPSHLSHSNSADDQLPPVLHFPLCRTCVSPVDRMLAVLHFPTQFSHSNNADDQLPPVLQFPLCRICISPNDGMPVSSPDFDRLPAVLHFPPDRTCVSPVDRIPAALHFPTRCNDAVDTGSSRDPL